MKVKSIIPVSFASLAIFVVQASADTLRLRDGRVMNGTFVGGGQDSISFQRDSGRVERVRLGEIDTLTFGSSGYTSSGATNSPGEYPERGAGGLSDRSNYNDRQTNDRGYYRDNRPPDSANAGRVENDLQQTPPPPPQATSRTNASAYVLPAGTVVSARTIDRIDSDASRAGETFPASLDYPVTANGQTIASKGNPATLQIVEVSNGGRINGRGEISLALVSFQGDDGRTYAMSTNSDTITGSSRSRQSAGVIGGGAALGAILGAVAGGGAGAAIGAASGAAVGTGAQLLRGTTVKVPAETRLNFTLNRDVSLNY